ncbi:MAG: ABC transporter permease subunit [Burkholderiales bacterium]|nr:ABC transporter permease subunit [Burkholderiales bacterium]
MAEAARRGAAARAPRASAFERALGGGVIVLLLACVEAAVRAKLVNPALIPAPSSVAARLWEILSSGDFLKPLGVTLYLLGIAYFAACALAIAAGIAMGRSRAAYNLLEPLVEVIRPLPKPALLPPLILFLGLGDAMKLSIIGLGVFFPVLINTVQGVRGVDPVLIDTGRTFRVGRAVLILRVLLPAALPLILAGMRVALGLGLVLVVIAEMLSGTGGVGYLVIDMQRSFRVQHMYAWVVILAVLGYALNAAFLKAEHRLIHWAHAKPE